MMHGQKDIKSHRHSEFLDPEFQENFVYPIQLCGLSHTPFFSEIGNVSCPETSCF